MPQTRLELLYLDSRSTPDLGTARDRGLDGLMIRLGQGGDLRDTSDRLDPYIDVGFVGHRLSAVTYGMPYGVVYRCVALSEETAEQEADWLVRQLSAIREELGLYVVLHAEDLLQYPRHSRIGKMATERVLRLIAGRLTIEGYRVLIYINDHILATTVPQSLLKTYGAYVVQHNVAERMIRTNRNLKPVIWEYGDSLLGAAVGCVCFGTAERVELKHIRVTTGAAVRLVPGTKLYARADDPRPCSILGQKITRYVWSDKKKRGKYAITLLAQFAEKPSRITCYVPARDIEIGILRERIDA